MHRNKFYLIIFFVSLSLTSFSQSQEKKVDVNKDIDLVKVYAQVVKEGYGTPQIYKELANAYYFRSNYTASKKWFEKLFSVEETIDELHLYRYKQSLKALGEYSKKNEYFAVNGAN